MLRCLLVIHYVRKSDYTLQSQARVGVEVKTAVTQKERNGKLHACTYSEHATTAVYRQLHTAHHVWASYEAAVLNACNYSTSALPDSAGVS